MTSTDRPTYGYVLLMTLIAVALVALSLVGAARRGLQLRAEAADRQRSLQRRWGALSCQRFLSSAAPTVLAVEEQRTGTFAVAAVRTVRLGQINFDLRWEDEQAKTNIATIYQQCGGLSEPTQLALKKLLPQQHSSRVQLRPFANGTFGSYGQIWSSPTGESLFEGGNLAPTRWIGCWGSGKLNARRASEDALKIALDHTLRADQLHQLLQCRQRMPTKSLTEWLNQLGLSEETRSRTIALLCDGSSCASLLIRASDGKKTEYRLTVLEDSGQEDEIERHFQW